MTPQEKSMIDGLIQRVNSTPVSEKDPEAEQLLQQGLGRNPDALYVLAQTVLVQGYALEQAQRQLADARAQLQQAQQQPKKSTSFLGSLLGHDDPEPTPPPPPPRPYTQPGTPAYAPVAGYQQAPPQYQQQPPAGYAPAGYAPAAPAGGGFLRGAMQTATGVAAGALAFEGIESLMHGFGHSAGYGSDQALGGFGGGAPREEVINNYYGDSAGSHEGSDTGLSPDIEDRRFDNDNSDRLAGNSGDNTDYGTDNTDDTSSDFADDNTADDSSMDDSGSFDDGGSDDSSFS